MWLWMYSIRDSAFIFLCAVREEGVRREEEREGGRKRGWRRERGG